jgi:hypothetical protein
MGNLFIIVEKYEKEMLRELVLNPGLRVVVWNRKESVVKYRDSKVIFASGLMSEIEMYLHEHRSMLVTKNDC